MSGTEKITYFASPNRKNGQAIKKERDIILSVQNIQTFLNEIPSFALILNPERQIVFNNQPLLDMLGMNDIDQVLGMRPGELLHCIHAYEMTSGCGSSKSCRYCGCIAAILRCQQTQQPVSQECRITSKINGQLTPFDLHITARPFKGLENAFTLVFIIDISAQKQKERLEQIFFHDIINSSWGLMLLAKQIPNEIVEETYVEAIKRLKNLSSSLVEEILAQKDLLEAEKGSLKPKFTKVDSKKMLEATYEAIMDYDITKGKQIEIDVTAGSILVKTDSRILRRVLINLLKNALEASKENDIIRIGQTLTDNKLVFWLNNPAIMTEEVQHQIFQRSFSTKGTGRGIGLYSVKLLTEQYLHGKVWFESSKEKGTIFYVNLALT